MIKYSILIPSYNEFENLKILIPEIINIIKGDFQSYEIILIDRKKKDNNTFELAMKYNIKHIERSGGDRYGDAVRSGILVAKGSTIIFMDADGSHNPKEILEWVFSHGVDQTIISYNFDPDEFRQVVTQGTIQINKLTTKLNNKISSNAGHKEFFSNLKHAAYTDSMEVLFVNRGVDISRPLSAQNDCFWWGYQNFSQINKPYFSFKRIVRGYQSNTDNDIKSAKTKILCTLFKQPLENKKILAGIFSKNGDILELFESK